MKLTTRPGYKVRYTDWAEQWTAAVAARTDFTASNICGVKEPGPGVGWLNDEWADRYRQDEPCYAIYSYRTPIAWWTEETGWVQVTQKFSVTTGKHQGIVRRAIAGLHT